VTMRLTSPQLQPRERSNDYSQYIEYRLVVLKLNDFRIKIYVKSIQVMGIIGTHSL
jgi:hypothetical protein